MYECWKNVTKIPLSFDIVTTFQCEMVRVSARRVNGALVRWRSLNERYRIEARTYPNQAVDCRWQASSWKNSIPPAICRNSCKTLQILSDDFRRRGSPFNGLGVFHRRVEYAWWSG